MSSLAAALAVALALGAGGGAPTPGSAKAAPTSQAAVNAARARAGLLPRKPAKKVRMTTRTGRRIITARSHEPTFLGEPEPIPQAVEDGSDAVIELVASAAPEPTGEPDLEPPPALEAPVPVTDEVHLSASSVSTEARLTILLPPAP